MDELSRPIRPETAALDALIQETIAHVEASPGSEAADTMIFLGNRHQSFPTAVIRDPVLEPVDKLVWMVIMLGVRETGGNTAFPSYHAIARQANVSSRSTVARAIAILRATRWLTLCGRLRKSNGRFRGNLYALHDEPLPLADVIHLDRDYMGFLKKSVSHSHARVRAVAKGVLDSIDEDIRHGCDPCRLEHPIERRIQSIAVSNDGRPRRFFSFTPKVIRQLRMETVGRSDPLEHHDQISNPVGTRVQNSCVEDSNSDRGSSCKKIKTTTTSTETHSKFEVADEAGRPLVYPRRLSDNQREIADRYLSRLPPASRQAVLDELEGRFQAELRGMKPVYDEIRFLARLCELARSGEFHPNLGIKVREARRAQELSQQRAAQMAASTPKETEAEREKRMAEAQRRLADMRKLLGMSAGGESHSNLEK